MFLRAGERGERSLLSRGTWSGGDPEHIRNLIVGVTVSEASAWAAAEQSVAPRVPMGERRGSRTREHRRHGWRRRAAGADVATTPRNAPRSRPTHAAGRRRHADGRGRARLAHEGDRHAAEALQRTRTSWTRDRGAGHGSPDLIVVIGEVTAAGHVGRSDRRGSGPTRGLRRGRTRIVPTHPEPSRACGALAQPSCNNTSTPRRRLRRD